MSIYKKPCTVRYKLRGHDVVYQRTFEDHYLARYFEKLNPNLVVVSWTPPYK